MSTLSKAVNTNLRRPSFGDVLREVPSAAGKVVQGLAMGTGIPQALTTGYQAMRGIAGLGAYGLSKALNKPQTGQNILNGMNPHSTNIPGLGAVQPATNPLQAASVGARAGLTLAPFLRGALGSAPSVQQATGPYLGPISGLSNGGFNMVKGMMSPGVADFISRFGLK